MLRSALTRSSRLPSSFFNPSTSSSSSKLSSSRFPTHHLQQLRSLSGPPPPLPPPARKPRPFYRRHPYWFALGISPIVVTASLGVTLLVLLGYDASTYSHNPAHDKPVDPLALKPERGGKKNLKVAQVLMDDQDERMIASSGEGKKKLVIVGGGWGTVGILKHLDPDLWHVTVVSPENYFLFQPLLPSATVGTVEVRSLVEPLRKIIARVSGHFLQGRAVDVDFSERMLEIESSGGKENFYLPYDKLVIACGSVNSTHGVPGLENCFQLKTVQDAQAIRRRVMDNLEKAALPSVDEDERKRLLSFVVCGGGPTGVEFASELWEMVTEDVEKYMPHYLRGEIRVHIIQSRDHILNTYAEKISQYAEERFRRNEIDMILNARVKEVHPEKVVYTTKDPQTGAMSQHEVDSGFTLWSTGIAMNPFTKRVASLLPNQYHKHALEVDSHLRVLGAPLGTVYALGDCATIETNLVDHLLEFVERCDEDKDGKIDQREFQKMMGYVQRKFPASKKHLGKIYDVFDKYKRSDETLGLNELADMFIQISKKITALPATAQVADQEGKYLGKKFSKLARAHNDQVAIDNGVYDDPDDLLYEPFSYRHMGSLAYIGNSAVFDIDNFSFAGGLAAMYLWRSVYLSEAVSLRTRCLLMLDWIKRGVFGRDLSRF
ncbi:uncharacterized protein JCM6883_002155 [Sporobolomyces salmoneus]|uniref:uncharacterized protein n=1 Tax=Sporobolomyces salmoneus TaxID=183962 RepID=UPI00317C3B6E